MKDTFILYIKDDCKACEGMVEKAAKFAVDYGMAYEIYNDSEKVPGIPCINYCEYWIVGNRAFDRLLELVRIKMEKIDA